MTNPTETMTNATLTSRTLRIGGFRTKFIEAGDPTAPAVVFVHDGAFGGDGHNTFGEVMRRLAGSYHVLAPDLLGWGGTDKVVFLDRSPYASRIEHIAAFCDTLGLDDAVFVGNSFGGSLVLRAATGPHPAWPMRAAVSISGTGGPFRLPKATAAIGDYTPSIEDAHKLTGWLVEDAGTVEEHVRNRYRASMIPGHWEAMNALRLRNPSLPEPAPRTDPFPEDLAYSPVPMLLIEGSKDRMLEPGWSEKLAGHNPDIERMVIDAAHSPNIDQPEFTAGLIRNFLGTLA